jgi:hypothetical protein
MAVIIMLRDILRYYVDVDHFRRAVGGQSIAIWGLKFRRQVETLMSLAGTDFVSAVNSRRGGYNLDKHSMRGIVCVV